MSNTKKLPLIAVTLAAITLSSVVAANPGYGPKHEERCGNDKGHYSYHHGRGEAHSERRLQKMQRYLELSDAQTAELKALFEQHEAEAPDQRRALRKAMQELNPEDSGYQSQVDALILQAQKQVAERIQGKAELRQQVYQLLTPQQREKMREMPHQRGHKGGYAQ